MSGLSRRFRLGLVLLFLFPAASHAETDVLLQAVGFALTGSDNAKVSVIDRKNCIFRVGYHDVFHLNNVHFDRIEVQEWLETSRVRGELRYLTVSLHGSQIVLERNNRVDESSFSAEDIRTLRQIDPSAFKDSIESFKETKLTLDTTEIDRVKRAWNFII